MWQKIKAGLGLNKADIVDQIAAQAKAESDAREKRAEAKAEKAKTKVLSPKDEATAKNEPYIDILSISIEENDPGQGAFELDWNDIFVARLIKAGYQGKTDQDIVDNWFQTVCRNVVLDTYAQEQADPELRNNNRRNLGNGRTEVS